MTERIIAEPLLMTKDVVSEVDLVLLGGHPHVSGGEPATTTTRLRQPQQAQAGTTWHDVGSHDTLTSLAVRYDMTKESIRILNKLQHSDLFPGQRLLVKDPHSTDKCSLFQAVEHGSIDADKDEPHSGQENRRGDVTPKEKPLNTAELSREYAKRDGTELCVKVLYMTRDRGLIPGFLNADGQTVRYTPDESNDLVREYGSQNFTLEFEHDDLLPPTTQLKPPKLRNLPTVGAGRAGHREDIAAASLSHDGTKMPFFLQLRLRLVYGLQPTPQTVAQYWFAVMPQWIDRVYDLLDRNARVCAESPMLSDYESPTVSPAVPESPQLSTPRRRSMSLSGLEEVTLLSESELLTPGTASRIASHLPLRLRYSDWSRVYSTYENGMSLQTMFRRLANDIKEPCLTLVRDTNRHVFGCYTTESWRPENHSYGGGECQVFQIEPKRVFYEWSSRQVRKSIFMTATDEYIMIGGGNSLGEDATGSAAIYLDADFLRGASNRSTTFSNDCLASGSDFAIDGVEVWHFVSSE